MGGVREEKEGGLEERGGGRKDLEGREGGRGGEARGRASDMGEEKGRWDSLSVQVSG